MSMDLKQDCIVINIPPSEIVAKCRIGNELKHADVAGYYTNDDDTKKAEIDKFFGGFVLPFYVPAQKFKTYALQVRKYLFTNKNFFGEGLNDFEAAFNHFGTVDQQLPGLFFGGNGGRYLHFVNDDVQVKMFRESLFEGAADLIIEKLPDRFLIYPSFTFTFLKKIQLEPGVFKNEDVEDLSENELADILKSWLEKDAESRWTLIRLFGIEYGQTIKTKGLVCDSIVTKAGLEATSVAELYKGITLSKYVALKSDFTPSTVTLVEKDEDEIEETKQVFSPRTNKVNPLNTIVYGAPGTGKTYFTAYYAVSIIENTKPDAGKLWHAEERKELMAKYNSYLSSDQLEFTTFHQNYGYEDFIEGLHPEVGANKDLVFAKRDGIFKKIVQRAIKDPSHEYVLIVDEINRGNISKIFGELITLIEPDKRFGEIDQLVATLPSGDKFTVPNNLYIVGTMNTADKSISLIDAALRRRFSFVEMPPRSSFVDDAMLKKIMGSINGFLLNEDTGNKDLLIGQSYFMHKTADDLPEILNENIIPLLYEYLDDSEPDVQKALECLKETDVEIDEQHYGRIAVKKK